MLLADAPSRCETWPVTARLADRLAAARRRAFVGRRAEFALFSAMLAGDDAGTVLYVHGPGGVGKSCLLRQLGWQTESLGRPVVWVDGREPDPGAACAGVTCHGVLLLDEVGALGGPRADVLEGLLSGLPAGAVAVLAGREPPPLPWRTDPGWRSFPAPGQPGTRSVSEPCAFRSGRRRRADRRAPGPR
jgi:hypothetical protein